MDRWVFDLEADDIYATKIHCLCYCNTKDGVVHALSSYEEMREFFQNEGVFIGHNILRYDIPTLERLLGIHINRRMVDTLALSWYVSSERNRHHLEGYGEEYGIEKPKIDNWKDLDVGVYIHRCTEDVKINTKMWRHQYSYLRELYDRDDEAIFHLIDFLSFKMSCAAQQERLGVSLDVPHCQQTLLELQGAKENKTTELRRAMPKVPVISLKMPPKVATRKDGTLSVHGEAWQALLKERELPENHTEAVAVIKGEEEPNPNSHDQLKKWLYSLGWEPDHFKHVRDKEKGTTKKIPQIAHPEGMGELSESVKVLIEKEPKLELLSGLSILSHRISLFKGFLEDQRGGKLFPTIMGFTNTLRMQHAVIVNLPGLDKKYGEEIRGSLIASGGCILLGSDLANIEDRTKRHFIYKYDPEYVKEMDKPGYDAHLNIAVLAGMLTEEQAEAHKSGKENHFAIRQKAKIVNFSATYKIGAPALARNNNWKLLEAQKLLYTYWSRNKAILDVERECQVKEIGAKKWLFNPISKIWYQLRSEKDRFSTLNQGTAAYVFDLWLAYIWKQGLPINFQYHDEFMADIPSEKKQWATDVVNESIRVINEELNLNVPIGCSIHFGAKYSDIH